MWCNFRSQMTESQSVHLVLFKGLLFGYFPQRNVHFFKKPGMHGDCSFLDPLIIPPSLAQYFCSLHPMPISHSMNGGYNFRLATLQSFQNKPHSLGSMASPLLSTIQILAWSLYNHNNIVIVLFPWNSRHLVLWQPIS